MPETTELPSNLVVGCWLEECQTCAQHGDNELNLMFVVGHVSPALGHKLGKDLTQLLQNYLTSLAATIN